MQHPSPQALTHPFTVRMHILKWQWVICGGRKELIRVLPAPKGSWLPPRVLARDCCSCFWPHVSQWSQEIQHLGTEEGLNDLPFLLQVWIQQTRQSSMCHLS